MKSKTIVNTGCLVLVSKQFEEEERSSVILLGRPFTVVVLLDRLGVYFQHLIWCGGSGLLVMSSAVTSYEVLLAAVVLIFFQEP
jgi:hypothetical protein